MLNKDTFYRVHYIRVYSIQCDAIRSEKFEFTLPHSVVQSAKL